MVQLSHATTVALLAGSALAAVGDERKEFNEPLPLTHERGRERERELAVPPARRSLHARSAQSTSEFPDKASADFATQQGDGSSSKHGHHRNLDRSSSMQGMQDPYSTMSPMDGSGAGFSKHQKNYRQMDSSMDQMYGSPSKHGHHHKLDRSSSMQDMQDPYSAMSSMDGSGEGLGKHQKHHGQMDSSADQMYGSPSKHGMHHKQDLYSRSVDESAMSLSRRSPHGEDGLTTDSTMDPMDYGGSKKHRHHHQQDQYAMSAMDGSGDGYSKSWKHHGQTGSMNQMYDSPSKHGRHNKQDLDSTSMGSSAMSLGRRSPDHNDGLTTDTMYGGSKKHGHQDPYSLDGMSTGSQMDSMYGSSSKHVHHHKLGRSSSMPTTQDSYSAMSSMDGSGGGFSTSRKQRKQEDSSTLLNRRSPSGGYQDQATSGLSKHNQLQYGSSTEQTYGNLGKQGKHSNQKDYSADPMTSGLSGKGGKIPTAASTTMSGLGKRSIIGNLKLGEPHPGLQPPPLNMLEVPCPGDCPGQQPEHQPGPPGQMKVIGHIKDANHPEAHPEQMPFPIFPLPHPPSLIAEAMQQHPAPPAMLMVHQKDAEPPKAPAPEKEVPKQVDPGMVSMIARLKDKMPGKLWNNPEGFTVQHTLRFRPGGATEKKDGAGKVLAAGIPPPRPVLRALILKLKSKGGPDAAKAKKLHKLDRQVIEKLITDKEGLEKKLKANKKALKKQKAALKKVQEKKADKEKTESKAGSGGSESESNTISITHSSSKPNGDKAEHSKADKKSGSGDSSSEASAGSAKSDSSAEKHESSGHDSGSESGSEKHESSGAAKSKHHHHHHTKDKHRHRHHARSFVPRSAEPEAYPEAWAEPEAEAEADPGVWADEETFFYEQ